MTTSGTSVGHRGGLNGGPASWGHYTWHTDQSAHHVTLQISQGPEVLIGVNLCLKFRQWVIGVARDGLVIIVLVNFLDSCLKDWHYSVRLHPKLCCESLVETQKQLHADLEEETAFSGILLQLFPMVLKKDNKSDWNLYQFPQLTYRWKCSSLGSPGWKS